MSGAQPDWVEPELATLTRDRFSDPAWIYERKFDGERCLAYRDGRRLRLMTRNRQQVNTTTAGELRHPRYQGLRRDKDPAAVTRERPQP